MSQVVLMRFSIQILIRISGMPHNFAEILNGIKCLPGHSGISN